MAWKLFFGKHSLSQQRLRPGGLLSDLNDETHGSELLAASAINAFGFSFSPFPPFPPLAAGLAFLDDLFIHNLLW